MGFEARRIEDVGSASVCTLIDIGANEMTKGRPRAEVTSLGGAFLPPFPPRAIVVVRPGPLSDAVLERLPDPHLSNAPSGWVARLTTRGGYTWDVAVAQPTTAITSARAFRPHVAVLIDAATPLGQGRPGDFVLTTHVQSWDEHGVVFSWDADFSAFDNGGPVLAERIGEPASARRTVWLAPLIAGPTVHLLDAGARRVMLRASGVRTMALEPADSQLVATLQACADVPTIVVRTFVDRAGREPDSASARTLGDVPVSLLESCDRVWASNARLFLDAARDGLEDHADEVVPALDAAAREFITRDTFPETWAMIEKVLGDAWRERGERGQPADLERSVGAYESALSVLDPGSQPDLWARAKCGLGQALAARRGSERAGSIEDALLAFEEAIEVQDQPGLREDWARTQHAKGLALRRRLAGDRAANLENAILAFRAALGVFGGSAEHFSERARASINLATTYRERLLGLPEQNRRDALALIWEVVQAAHENGFAEEFAAASYTLGLALGEEPDEEARPAALAAARVAYEQALTVWTRSSFPRDWALAQIALGNVHRQLAALDDPEGNLEQARQAYERALELYTRESDPQRWAAAKLNLGNVYRDLATGSNDENFEEAIGAYRDAGEVYSIHTDPAAARLVRTNLGRLLLTMGLTERAYAVLQEAMEADRRSYAQARTEAARRAEVAEAERLYEAIVECSLRLQRVLDAFLFADASRSRLLREQLGTRELPPPASVPAQLLAEEALLLARLSSLSGPDENPLAARSGTGWNDAVRDADQARHELERLWERLRRDYAAGDYVALRRGEGLDWHAVRAWLEAQSREVAILEFYSLEDSTAAFIVRKGDDQPRQLLIPLGREDLASCVTSLYYEVHRSTPDSLRTETWKLRAAPLLAQAVDELDRVDLLYLVPHGELHYLPLHAIERDGRALIERTAIAYAPSAAVALRLSSAPERAWRGSEPQADGSSALVIGDPEGDRPFAAHEAELVASRLGATPLIGSAASKRVVATKLQRAEVAHVASHAFFDDDDPLASGLVLAEGEPRGVLTARELIVTSLSAQLLVLSGCQTGLQDVRPGDELVGLSRALFYAGVPSLVLSLWEVNDPATAELMLAFYDGLDKAHDGTAALADALRSAMVQLRAKQPHTYLWGAFALFGRCR